MVLGWALLHPTYGDPIALFSNLPKVVQQKLESRRDDCFIDDYMIISAGLFAEEADNPASTSFFPPRIAEDFSIGQSHSKAGLPHEDLARYLSIPEVGVSQPKTVTTNLNVLEVGPLSGSPAETRIDQFSTLKISVVQNTGSKVGLADVSITEISPTQISILESDAFKLGSFKTGTFQVSVVKRDLAQIGPSQIGSSQNDPVQFKIMQSATTPVHPREVPLSINEKSLPQLLSVHDSSLQLGIFSYSTIQFLQAGLGTFDFNIEITDLPTGQLAVRSALLNFHRAVKEGRYQLE
jgi:hypothetical protein